MLKVFLHVYKLYSLCKHLSHSHTKLYAMSCKCRHSNSTIYLKCRTCHSHPSISHTEHILSCWFEVSCRQVMLSVCSQGCVYTSQLTHTLSHFCQRSIDHTTLHQSDQRWAELHSLNPQWPSTAAHNYVELKGASQTVCTMQSWNRPS